MYSNKNLNYTQIKQYIKRLIALFANKKEFDITLTEFTRHLGNGTNDKYEWINKHCFNVCMNEVLNKIQDDTLIIQLINLYGHHLVQEGKNNELIRLQLKREFGKWARW